MWVILEQGSIHTTPIEEKKRPIRDYFWTRSIFVQGSIHGEHSEK